MDSGAMGAYLSPKSAAPAVDDSPGQRCLVLKVLVEGGLADACLATDLFHCDPAHAVFDKQGLAGLDQLIEFLGHIGPLDIANVS